MDSLTEALATSFQVSKDPNSTAAEHPRFSQFKQKTASGGSQEERRRRILELQKQKRFDYVNHARRLGEDFWEDAKDEEYSDGNEDMDVQVPALSKPGRHYKNQLMLSEWLVDVPHDFEEKYLLVPCPEGRRCLVVASQGKTASYAKNGWRINSFPSSLPGGNRRQGKIGYSLLDCIYVETQKTYYILDLMCWRSHPVFDSETEFRFFWMDQKISESPEISSVSSVNPFKFEKLPHVPCTKGAITELLSKPMELKLDGLLFYHKKTHYTFGSTPLVGWLKPFMVPEILDISVTESISSLAPGDYTNAANYRESFEQRWKHKGKRKPHTSKKQNKNEEVDMALCEEKLQDVENSSALQADAHSGMCGDT